MVNIFSKNFDVILNPEKYGYEVCEHCNGYGNSLKEKADRCTVCGGSGVVKKKKEVKNSKK